MSYPLFQPPPGLYPQPNFQDLNPNNFLSPFPTSSWFQEGLVNNLADVDRVANGTPWFVRPVYSNVQVGLSFGSIDDVTTSLDYGNIILQEAAKGQLLLEVENADKLTLNNLTDLSTQLIYSVQENNNRVNLAEFNFVRGTPTVNLDVTNASVILRAQSGLEALDRVNNDTYFLRNVIGIASTVSAPLFPVNGNPNINQSQNLSFYRFVNPIPGESINVTYGIIDGQNSIHATYMKNGLSFELRLLVNDPTTVLSIVPPEFRVENYISYPKNRVLGFVVTGPNPVNPPPGFAGPDVDKIIVDLDSKIVTVTRTVQERHRWIIYSNASIVTLNQGSALVRTNRFTGYFRVAYGGRIVGDMIDFFGNLLPLDSQVLSNAFALGTIRNGIIPDNFTERTNNNLVSWSYQMIYDQPGVLFLPSHLVSNNFTLEGVELFTDPLISWLSISYGRMNLYRINTNVRVTTQPIQIEDFQNVRGLFGNPPNDAAQRLMRQLILIDATRSGEELTVVREGQILTRTDLNPYDFGQIVAKAARVLLLAVKLQEELDIPQIVIDFLQIAIRGNLLTWLNGTNNLPDQDNFQLQREPVWSGIIVPADSNNLIDEDSPTAYGNSFYNDHHYHYGYIVYALAVLEEVGFGLFSEFPTNILLLVQDYSNPDYNIFTRLRHKDMFMGHSWATGVPGEPTVEAGVEGAGPVNRQQESASEAINAYYSAYLLAKQINNLRIRTAAGLALYLEMIAARFYYLYDAPESALGELVNTGSIGIMQTLGKSFTLNWPMQPPTFPGRSFGIYGIQAIPFTEISGNYLTNVFNVPFSQPSMSRYVFRMSQFGMNFEIVRSVLDGTYMPNPPDQGPNNEIPYSVQNDGTYWGNVAMQMLAFSERAATDAQIKELFTIIINKLRQGMTPVLKDFCSFSNTFYMLLRLRGLEITPLGAPPGIIDVAKEFKLIDHLEVIKEVERKRLRYHETPIRHLMLEKEINSVNVSVKSSIENHVDAGVETDKVPVDAALIETPPKTPVDAALIETPLEALVKASNKKSKKQVKITKKTKKNTGKTKMRDDLESDTSGSNEEQSLSSSSSEHSKIMRKQNKYKYKASNYTAELFVIRKRCAMLKYMIGDQQTIVKKDELPYIVEKTESLNEQQLAKFIIIYETYKRAKLFENQVTQYLNDPNYQTYLMRYTK